MSATTARIQRRLRNGARTGNLDTTKPDTLRLVLSAALFDGENVPAWRCAAACRDVDPETFYPPQGWAGTLLTATAVAFAGGMPRAGCLPRRRHGVGTADRATRRRRRSHRPGAQPTRPTARRAVDRTAEGGASA